MKTKPAKNHRKPPLHQDRKESPVPQNGWMDLVELKERMHISDSTAYRWREMGLPFAKHGHKIYVHTAHLDEFLLRATIMAGPKKTPRSPGKKE